MLIGGLLRRALASCPQHPAATLGEDSVSFAELDRRADRMAAVLAGRLAPGEVLLWWTATRLECLIVLLASARAGLILVPANPALAPAELASVIKVVRPSLLVSDGGGSGGWGVPELRLPELLELCEKVADSGAGLSEVDPDSGHIGYLTSGSTGVPKAVLVSHRASWIRSSAGGGTFAGSLRGDGGLLCTFPLYHYGGWHYVMEAWLAMTTIHLVPRAGAEEVLVACRRRRPSALYAIPAVWERILLLAAPDDLASLRHCDTGTSPVDGNLVARIRELAPQALISIHYGSTEAGRMATLPDWQLAQHPGSVGRAAFPCELWLDAEGQVCVAGPGLALGYLNQPERTATAFAGGCYRTGDLGRLDGDGFLSLTGRTGEVIRTGGEFVAPAEVETALRRHPGVADVAVVGLPDPVWHEVVCAVVVPRTGVRLDLESLRRSCCADLLPHKHPRRLEFVAEIWRTPATGQIQRGRIRDALLE